MLSTPHTPDKGKAAASGKGNSMVLKVALQVLVYVGPQESCTKLILG